MGFGRQKEEGLSAVVARTRRAVVKYTAPVTQQLRNAQSRATQLVQKVDARAVQSLVSLSRRTGSPQSAEYVRGALHSCLAVAGAGVLCVGLARSAHRIRTASDVPARMIGTGRSFRALVARVGDGDGMRVAHLPPLRVPFRARRRLPRLRARDTVSLRLAGVDAPECAHFGQPGQAYGADAREWLERYVVGRRVRVVVHAVDQYHRALASVFRQRSPPLRWLGLGERNVSVELARAGYATIYEGGGAQFGGARRQIERAVESAKRRRVGMWAARGTLETPAEFKRRLKAGGALPKGKGAAGKEAEVGVKEVIGVAQTIYKFLQKLR